MSRGFVKESDQEEAPFIPPRAALPEGTTNYVTPRGLTQLSTERDELEAQRATLLAQESDQARRELTVVKAKLAQLEPRLASAQVLTPADVDNDEVRFGASITYALQTGPRAGKPITVTIVGVDEANVRDRRISFLSPIAQAVTGKRVGDTVNLNLGADDQQLKLLAITYAE